jgi:hypothetical protein
MSMTPYESHKADSTRNEPSTSLMSKFKMSPNQNPKKPKPESNAKETFLRDLEKWALLKTLNLDEPKGRNFLERAEHRLRTFLHYYETSLSGGSLKYTSEGALSFGSISAIKFITGVNILVTHGILTEFKNFDLKTTDTMRTLRLDDTKFYGIEWAWQFAIDNPTSECYNYSTNTLSQRLTQPDQLGKTVTAGPPNFHAVHGGSFADFPFSKNSFSFELAFGLFFELKEQEWVPTLTELYRVLQPQGTLSMLLIDFTAVNCQNEVYNKFFANIRKILERKGMDPMPCRSIQSRMHEAGFDEIKYSFLSLKKGIPNRLGMTMDFIQGYLEFLIFDRIAKFEMDEAELQEFRSVKLQFHEDLRNGRLTEEFGDFYLMFAFGRKY